jgi:hypothetical protein
MSSLLAMTPNSRVFFAVAGLGFPVSAGEAVAIHAIIPANAKDIQMTDKHLGLITRALVRRCMLRRLARPFA